MMNYKNLDWKVQDIDESHRKVQIYVSAFNVLDSDGDIVTPGAFRKTIDERGPKSAKPRIKHLRDHWDLIGVPEEMSEDKRGLVVLSVLSNSAKGRDAIEDYKLNALEHSIGYQATKWERQDETVRYLNEITLWEYSSVTWGANADTPLVAMKGYNSKEILDRINKKVDVVSNALRKGNYTDERFEELEFQLQHIKKSYNDYISLLGSEPSPDTLGEEPKFSELGSLIKNLTIKLNGK